MPHTEDCLLQELYEDDGNIEALFTTFWRLPLLYLTLMAVRFVCIAVFNPLFQLTNAGLLSAIHRSYGTILRTLFQRLFWAS